MSRCAILICGGGFKREVHELHELVGCGIHPVSVASTI